MRDFLIVTAGAFWLVILAAAVFIVTARLAWRSARRRA